MPSPLTHALAGVACALPFTALPQVARRQDGVRLLLTAGLFAELPDYDSLLVRFTDAYPLLEHRGALHAPLLMAAAALVFGLLLRRFLPDDCKDLWRPLAAALLLGGASHGYLDALSRGGRDVMLLFPLSTTRLHLPFRPIVIPWAADTASPTLAEALGILKAEIRWWPALFLPSALARFFLFRPSPTLAEAPKRA